MNVLSSGSVRLIVTDHSQIAEARRTVGSMGQDVGLDETDTGRATLVASEMATNLVKHGGGGSLLARALPDGLELLAIDQGPGMSDPAQCLRDGYSTAGSAGTGLGAIQRLSDAFDLYTRYGGGPGGGTVVLGRVRSRQRERSTPRFLIGAVSLPIDGETLSGDGWICHGDNGSLRLAVFDGLGHGIDANTAAEAALAFITPQRNEAPAAVLQRIHLGIRHTRGAAGAIYDLHANGCILRYAGVGNIAGTVVPEGEVRARSLMSHNGTLGHLATRFQEFTQPWMRSDVLVLATDGLQTRWDLDRYSGLRQRDPSVVAGMLWRDFRRGRDDVTVVVVREV